MGEIKAKAGNTFLKLLAGGHLVIVVHVHGARDDGRGKDQAQQGEEDRGSATAAAAAASAAFVLRLVAASAATFRHL
jgi:hypothetical protein